MKYVRGRFQITPTLQIWTNENSLHEMFVMLCKMRHFAGDWGEVSFAERQLNDDNVRNGGRLASMYSLNDIIVWVVTDPGHIVTTAMFAYELKDL